MIDRCALSLHMDKAQRDLIAQWEYEIEFPSFAETRKLARILLSAYAYACTGEISSDGDDDWDSWRNVSETGRLARVFSREERGMEGRWGFGWRVRRGGGRGGGADTRKRGVAEMGKREERREEAEACRRHRHINNTCRLLAPPLAPFRCLPWSPKLITGSDASNLSYPLALFLSPNLSLFLLRWPIFFSLCF